MYQLAKQHNPELFEDQVELQKRLAEFEKDLEVATDPIIRTVIIQGRNLLAYALNIELLPE